MRNAIKIAGVYIGIIIGAGFASGQEINSFFTVYGNRWIEGMIVAGLLFSVVGSTILGIIQKNAIDTYSGFVECVMGKKIGKGMEWISGIFLCILFFTMSAASGAVAKEAFHINYLIGVYGMLIGCFIVFLFDVRGVVLMNSILAPFLILSGIFIGIYAYIMEGVVDVFSFQEGFKNNQWAFSAVLYVSYNMITAVSVLVSMKPLLTSKKVARCAGILGGVSMALMGACMGAVLYIHYETVKGLEIPMLAIVGKYHSIIKNIYIFMLLAAIFTTAVGNGFGAVKWLESKLSVNPYFIKLLFLAVAGGMSWIGFSGFVGKLYPLFGFIGLLELFFIMWYGLKSKFVKNLQKY